MSRPASLRSGIHFDEGLSALVALIKIGPGMTWRPNRLQVISACKITLAALLGLLIALIVRLEDCTFAPYVAVIASTIYVGSTIRKAFAHLFGVIAGILVANALFAAFPQDRWLFSISYFCTICLAAYAKRYFPLFCMGLLWVPSVYIAAVIYQPEALAWSTSYFFIMSVFIGVGSAILVNTVVYPIRVRDQVKDKLAAIHEAQAAALDRLTGRRYDKEPYDVSAGSTHLEKIAGQIEAFEGTLSLYEKENLFNRKRAHYLRGTVHAMKVILVQLQSLNRMHEVFVRLEAAHGVFVPIREKLVQALNDIAKLAASGSRDAPVSLPAVEIASAAGLVDAWLSKNQNQSVPYQTVYQMLAIASTLDLLTRSISDIRQDFSVLKSIRSIPGISPRDRLELIRPIPAVREIDWVQVKYAISMGVIGLGSLWAYIWLRFPAGVTSYDSGLIIAQASPHSSTIKAIHRVSGCLIGAVCAIVFTILVTPEAVMYWQLALGMAPFLLCFTYVYSNPKIYYIGQQSCIAFLLGIATAGYQQVDIYPVGVRLAQIFLGFFVVYVVYVVLLPINPNKVLKNHLKAGLEAARVALDTILADLAEGRYEPENYKRCINIFHHRLKQAQLWMSEAQMGKTDPDDHAEQGRTLQHLSVMLIRIEALVYNIQYYRDAQLSEGARKHIQGIAESMHACLDLYLAKFSGEEAEAEPREPADLTARQEAFFAYMEERFAQAHDQSARDRLPRIAICYRIMRLCEHMKVLLASTAPSATRR